MAEVSSRAERVATQSDKERAALESELAMYKKALGELEGRFKILDSSRAQMESENSQFAQDSAICKEGFHRLKAEVEPLRAQLKEYKMRCEEANKHAK